ncbi:MAG: hypothetical protein HY043_13590 [Verrucomicrobia bacterium]|nr:hypothetical protein [Verrucomicrobiota bacterium]
MKQKILLYLTIAGWLIPADTRSAPASGLSEPIQIIRAVGSEGRGNDEATRVWKQLAGADASQLIEILSALDGANDFAANWLRSAVDAIAARETAAHRALSLADLGKFLLDTRHEPRARRLVFELIARADATAAEKLLPGMLNDPSLELRHDAVQKVIDQAAQLFEAGNKPGATLLYQQSLAFARDVDQVDLVAKKLKDLGQPVDLPKHFGFLTQWKVIGPFDNAGAKNFDTAFPPENKIDLAAEYDGKSGKVRWQDFTTKHNYGMVDMNQPCGKLKGVLSYAYTEFFSDKAQPVELRLGGKNSWKVWLNGKFLFGRDEYHRNAEIDQYRMPATLQGGRNTILVKVCQNEQTEDWTVEWEFQLRVTDSLGTPIFSNPDATRQTALNR